MLPLKLCKTNNKTFPSIPVFIIGQVFVDIRTGETKVIYRKLCTFWCIHIVSNPILLNKELHHTPVMGAEILSFFSESKPKSYLDGTLGLGGHMESILTHNPTIRVAVGIDLDLSHIEHTTLRLKESLGSRASICSFHHSGFDKLGDIATDLGIFGKVDAILLDLGICSAHVDIASRGFSFQQDGPLDMRFDMEQQVTAATIVNTYSEQELITLFFSLGEEPQSKRIAKAIVEQRKIKAFTLTSELVALCDKELQRDRRKHHNATKVFQALRLEVNQELKRLEDTMSIAMECLAPGGRLAILTYHSLEDRIVKHALKKEATDCICTNKMLPCDCNHLSTITLVQRKAFLPSPHEIQLNPRARSAKLRLAIKK